MSLAFYVLVILGIMEIINGFAEGALAGERKTGKHSGVVACCSVLVGIGLLLIAFGIIK